MPTPINRPALDAEAARPLLEARLAELRQSVRQRRDSLLVEQTADPLDTQQAAAHREFEVARLAQSGDELAQVLNALAAIGQGTWGVCRDCEEPINDRRLRLMPWAPRCVACQEAWEQHLHSDFAEPSGWAAMVA